MQLQTSVTQFFHSDYYHPLHFLWNLFSTVFDKVYHHPDPLPSTFCGCMLWSETTFKSRRQNRLKTDFLIFMNSFCLWKQNMLHQPSETPAG